MCNNLQKIRTTALEEIVKDPLVLSMAQCFVCILTELQSKKLLSGMPDFVRNLNSEGKTVIHHAGMMHYYVQGHE
jgi:hypothetical protein